MRRIHLGCGGGRCFQKQIISSKTSCPICVTSREKAVANSVSSFHVHMHVCLHTQGRKRRGRKERDTETELGNRIWKSFRELIHIDYECIFEKIVCLMVKNVVSKAKPSSFKSHFRHLLSDLGRASLPLYLCFLIYNRKDGEIIASSS